MLQQASKIRTYKIFIIKIEDMLPQDGYKLTKDAHVGQLSNSVCQVATICAKLELNKQQILQHCHKDPSAAQAFLLCRAHLKSNAIFRSWFCCCIIDCPDSGDIGVPSALLGEYNAILHQM